MDKFDFLNVSGRIRLVIAIPLFSVLFFAAQGVLDKRSQVTSTGKIVELVDVGETVSALVHEMQKERGMSAGFIGSKGRDFAQDLPEQRNRTDRRLLALNTAFDGFDARRFGAALSDRIAASRAALKNIAAIRTSVTDITATVPQMAKYYTTTITGLLSITEEMYGLTGDTKILSSIYSYTAFLQGKESAGIERAMGATGFGAGKFAPGTFQRFVGLMAMQNTYFNRFALSAGPRSKEIFNKAQTSAEFATVEKLRNIVLASPIAGTRGVKASDWFAAITAKINLMKKIEDIAAEELLENARTTHADAMQAFYVYLGGLIAILILTGFVSWQVIRSIVGPVTRLSQVMNRLAANENSVDVPDMDRRDEFGQMAKTVQVFKENGQKIAGFQGELEIREKRAQQEKEVAVKAVTDAEKTRAAGARRDSEEAAARTAFMKLICRTYEHRIASGMATLSDASGEVHSSAAVIRENANQTSSQSNTVSSAAGQATSNVETVAAAAEELSAFGREIVRIVQDNRKITDAAVEEASRAKEGVAMLDDAAEKIGNVVSLINEIASQTNLLALNATIEAARAGEAGKGFTVVATEVKSLADQTARATDEISSQVSEIQAAAGAAVESIGQIGGTIEQISTGTSSIVDAADKQKMAMEEIAASATDAATLTKDVTTSMEAVSMAAGQTDGAATKMSNLADSLSHETKDMSSLFREFMDEINSFENFIRAENAERQ